MSPHGRPKGESLRPTAEGAPVSPHGRPKGESPRQQAEGTPGNEREPVDVAVGVLIERDAQGREGRFLLTSRPAGKPYAGYWEFPGGKLERGESVQAALTRELHEELGIHVAAGQPWKVELMDYPHARVRLHFCKVFDWTGTFEMREGQQMAWQSLPVQVDPVLPGTLPVLDWFAQERGHAGPVLASPDD